MGAGWIPPGSKEGGTRLLLLQVISEIDPELGEGERGLIIFACINHFCLGVLTQTASPPTPHMHRLREKPILWSVSLVALLIAREKENQKIN